MGELIRHKSFWYIIFAGLFLFGCSIKKEPARVVTTVKPDSVTEVSFAVVGDLMCHSTQYNYAKTENGSYNFNNVFKYVKPIFDTTDVVIGNLETVTAGDSLGYRGYPVFNSPDEFVSSLKYAGFDILVTANNHCYDKRQFGLKRTIEVIKKNNLEYSGTFSSAKDADSVRVYNKNGIRFSLLSYSYGTNGFRVPEKYKYSVNVIDTSKIKQDIWKVKKLNPDLVILYYHFGYEYSTYPSKFQKEIVKKSFEYGADIIFASHPHVLQPVKIFRNKNSKLEWSFATYSLGNFISNQRWRYSDAGMILQFNISKNHSKDNMEIKSFSYLPTWVFKGLDKGKREYYILPTERFLDNKKIKFLTRADRDSMARSLRDTERILKRYSANIKKAR